MISQYFAYKIVMNLAKIILEIKQCDNKGSLSISSPIYDMGH